MTDCEHRGGRLQAPYRCAVCKVALCTVCADRPVWWYAEASHCRGCAVRRGQSADVVLDVDKLRAYLGYDKRQFEAFLHVLWMVGGRRDAASGE